MLKVFIQRFSTAIIKDNKRIKLCDKLKEKMMIKFVCYPYHTALV